MTDMSDPRPESMLTDVQFDYDPEPVRKRATAGASAPTPPGEGHRTGTGGPDAPGASEGLDAAIEAGARAIWRRGINRLLEYDDEAREAARFEDVGRDAAVWDDAETAVRIAEPILRQAVAEEIAARLIERGRDPLQNLAWMYPEQAAEIAREVGRGN